MRLIRAAIIMLVFCCAPAQAQSWPVKDINHAIEQTNFIVNGGCSGTLSAFAKS